MKFKILRRKVMNLSMTGRGVDLSEAMKNQITGAVESFEKYNLDIISANVIISSSTKKNKTGINVEFVLNLPNKNTIVINQLDKDAYAAVDISIDRVQKALRRHHDKIKSHKAERPSKAELATDGEPDIDEIIPTELDLYKPLEIGEALCQLKESGKQFLVFNDNDDNMRVIYKRSDEKFGLY